MRNAPFPPDRLPLRTDKTYWSVAEIFGRRPEIPARCFVEPRYSIDLHAQEFLELNYVVRGRGWHYMADARFPVRTGQVFVIPPNVRHGYVEERTLDVYHLLINPRFLEEHRGDLVTLPGYLPLFTVEPFFRKETQLRYALRLTGEAGRTFRRILDLLHDAVMGASAMHPAGSAGLLLYALTYAAEAYDRQHRHANPEEVRPNCGWHRLRAVFERVRRDFGEKLSLEDLAKEAHMQKNYFCRVFRKATGMTAMAYLRRVRVEAARQMLLEGELAVAEVALACGFCDAAHFSRVFSQETGLSPRACRDKFVPPLS